MKESKLSDTREKVVSRSGKRNRAPEERSSKIPLSRAGQAIPPNKLGPARRDPRFERSSGQFNQGLFEKSYGFVYDYEDEELLYLDKQIKQTSDPDLAASIKSRARSLVRRIVQESCTSE